VVWVHDVITPFKLGDDRFRGFGLAEGQTLPFPVDFEGRPHNTHTIVWGVIYACVKSTASPMLLCHLLYTYCLPILLYYGFEAVTISNANRQTLYVTWKTVLYKMFKLNDEVNLLYVQYCLDILPIFYVFDLRRLCFLCKQSTHIISVHNTFTMCLVF